MVLSIFMSSLNPNKRQKNRVVLLIIWTLIQATLSSSHKNTPLDNSKVSLLVGFLTHGPFLTRNYIIGTKSTTGNTRHWASRMEVGAILPSGLRQLYFSGKKIREDYHSLLDKVTHNEMKMQAGSRNMYVTSLQAFSSGLLNESDCHHPL